MIHQNFLRVSNKFLAPEPSPEEGSKGKVMGCEQRVNVGHSKCGSADPLVEGDT